MSAAAGVVDGRACHYQSAWGRHHRLWCCRWWWWWWRWRLRGGRAAAAAPCSGSIALPVKSMPLHWLPWILAQGAAVATACSVPPRPDSRHGSTTDWPRGLRRSRQLGRLPEERPRLPPPVPKPSVAQRPVQRHCVCDGAVAVVVDGDVDYPGCHHCHHHRRRDSHPHCGRSRCADDDHPIEGPCCSHRHHYRRSCLPASWRSCFPPAPHRRGSSEARQPSCERGERAGTRRAVRVVHDRAVRWTTAPQREAKRRTQPSARSAAARARSGRGCLQVGSAAAAGAVVVVERGRCCRARTTRHRYSTRRRSAWRSWRPWQARRRRRSAAAAAGATGTKKGRRRAGLSWRGWGTCSMVPVQMGRWCSRCAGCSFRCHRGCRAGAAGATMTSPHGASTKKEQGGEAGDAEMGVV